MTFGKKLRLIRTRRGLSQAELATLCGLSRRTVNSYESETSRPGSKFHYEMLANALGVSVSALINTDTTESVFDSQADRILGIDSAPEAVPGLSGEISSLLRSARLIFADNSISEMSKDMLMHALQEIYWDVKKDCFIKAGVKEENLRPDSADDISDLTEALTETDD